MRKHRLILTSFTSYLHRVRPAGTRLFLHRGGHGVMPKFASWLRDTNWLDMHRVPAHASRREVRFVAVNTVLVALSSTFWVVLAVVVLIGTLPIGLQPTASRTPGAIQRPATNPVPLGLTASLASYRLTAVRESTNAELGAAQGALSAVEQGGLTPASSGAPKSHLVAAANTAQRLREYFAALQWQRYTALGEIYQLEALAQAAAAARAGSNVAAVYTGPIAGGVWAALRECESGGNYAENTGNGYYGAYQFSLATWEGLGYTGLPSNAAPPVQDAAAQRLQAMSGWGQWPACAAKLGLI